MMKPAAVLFVNLACASIALSAEPLEWDSIYTGDRLPSETVPGWWWGNEGPNTEAKVTPDGLRIIDRGTARTNLRCYGTGWHACPAYVAMAEATVKVVSCTDNAGMCLLVSNGVNEDTLTLYPNRIELTHAKLSHQMDTTDRHHTYRVRILGNDITVWADSRLVLDGKGKFTAKAHNGRCGVIFGSISSPATGEAYWREVKYRVELPPVRVLPGARHVVIYKKQDIYACFPNIVQLDDGRLVVNFATRVRRSHIDGRGGSATYVSDDGGQTWQPNKQPYVDPRHHMPWGEYLRGGAGGWRHVPAEKQKELEAKGFWVRPVREGVVAHGGNPGWVSTSTDGKQWQKRTIPTPSFAFRQAYGPPGFLVTSKGTVLKAVYGKRSVDEEHGSLVMRSADQGKTWQWVTIAEAHGNQLGFNETALFENDAGEIGAMLRTSPEHNTFVSISRDDGKTWSPARDAGFWGYPCHVLKLPDGTLVCSYGYRKDRQGIRCRVSRDGGHTWDPDNEIVLRADAWGRGMDLGYPRSVLLPDGRIFTVYYINLKDNITHVAGTHWSVPKRLLKSGQ